MSGLPLTAADALLATIKAAIVKTCPLSPAEAPSASSVDSDEEIDEVNVPMPGERPEIPTVAPGLAMFENLHVLNSAWVLWFDSASKQDKVKSWDEALVKVIEFSSVEEFWS